MLTRGDGGPLALKLMGVASDSISAKLVEVEPGERYDLDVTVSPPFVSDRVSTDLRLQTGVPEAPTASVRVYASVSPRVTAHPQIVRIPEDREPDWEQTVNLIWDNGKPAKISSATIDNPKLSLKLEEVGGKQLLTLHPADGWTPRPRRHYVTLVTDDPKTPRIRMPLTVTVQGKLNRTQRGAASPARPIQKAGKRTVSHVTVPSPGASGTTKSPAPPTPKKK